MPKICSTAFLVWKKLSPKVNAFHFQKRYLNTAWKCVLEIWVLSSLAIDGHFNIWYFLCDGAASNRVTEFSRWLQGETWPRVQHLHSRGLDLYWITYIYNTPAVNVPLWRKNVLNNVAFIPTDYMRLTRDGQRFLFSASKLAQNRTEVFVS